MKFSLCSWTFGDLPLEDVISLAAKTGYDEVEVSAAVEAHDWSEVKKKTEQEGIVIRGINADANFLRPETNLANNDQKLRQQAIDYFKHQLDVGEYLGSEYMVLAPAAPGHLIPFLPDGGDWLNAVDSIKQLASYSEDYGINMVIEPLNRYENCLVYNANTAKQFLKDVNAPNVKTMLDTFHMNIEEANFIDPFKKLEGMIETVHVADSNRRGLGEGHIPFDQVIQGIKNIGYDKTITLECLVPNEHPFLPIDQQDIDLMYQYAKDSLHFLKNILNKR